MQTGYLLKDEGDRMAGHLGDVRSSSGVESLSLLENETDHEVGQMLNAAEKSGNYLSHFQNPLWFPVCQWEW